MATNSIPTSVATVSTVQGTVYVRDASGTLHRLQAGDVVTAGDVIITAADGHAEFAFDNGGTLALDPGIHKLGDRTPAEGSATVAGAANVDRIIQAIEQGQPIDDLLEETAAGLAAGGANEGHDFVRLGRVTEDVTGAAYKAPDALPAVPLGDLPNDAVPELESSLAPVAVDDLVAGLEDQTLTITAAQLFGADGTGPDNDSDGDSATFASITVVSLPGHGILQLDGQPVAAGQTIAVADIEAGRLTFVPDPDWHGSTTFVYTVSDGALTSNAATVTLSIASVNDAPVAVDNTVTVPEDTIKHGNVITDDDNGALPGGYDYDIDGDELTVTHFTIAGDAKVYQAGETATIAGVGTFKLDADGSYTFNPEQDYDGPVPVVTYTITDGHGGFDSATLTINLVGGDDTPVAGDDHAVTDEDTPITIPVLANDSDVDGDPITIIRINGTAVQAGDSIAVSHGTVTLNADGTVTFSPAPDYYGDTSFTYTITDGTTEVPATVYVKVNPVNDPPVANDDVASTPINTGIVIDVKANDSDPDNSPDELTVSSAVLSDPSQGTLTINPDGSLHFVPAQDVSGEVEITYTLTDPEGLSDSATVKVYVGPNTPPEGADVTRSTPEDTAYVIQKGDFGFSDPDASQTFHAVRIDSLPTDGTLMLNGQPVAAGQVIGVADIEAGGLRYVPDADEHGSPYGHFTFSVQDSAGAFDDDANTFTLDVTPVNDAPVALPNNYVTPEDTTISGNLVTDDGNGAAPGGVDYDIDGDELRVTQINGQDLTFDSTTGHATVVLDHGVLVIKNDGDFTFTPAADYNGTQAFTYTVSDGNGGSGSATVNITVDTVNDPPMANPDPIVIDEDVTSTFDPRANDVDIDTPHDQLVITSLNGQPVDPVHPENYAPTDVYDPSGKLAGQVYMTADGQVKFAPAPDYNNDPSNLPVIPYTISDGQGGSDSSYITIQVRPVNDAPVANNDVLNVYEDGPAVSGNVLANDIDVDGDDLVVVGFVAGNADDGHLETPDTDGSLGGTYGTLTWDAETGEYQYTVDNSNKTVQKLGPGQTLTDTFTYEVADGKGGIDTATLTVTIHGTDDGITITGIGSAAGDHVVREDDLPAGSSPNAGALSKSGSFTIEALDGIKTVEVGGTSLTVAQLTTASTYPVTIDTDHGTLVLTGYTGDDQGGTVSYTYTLKKSVDNDSQQGADTDHYVEQIAVTVTDADNDVKSSSINIDIADDAPTAADHTISGSAQANTNLMFIIDVAPKDDQYQGQIPNGPGMEDTGQFSGNPEWTRLHATVVAMHELIDRYDDMGEVRVYIVVFDSKGERVGGAWMTAAEARAFADQLETYIGSDGHPGGNYDAALAAAMDAYANPGDGKLADAQNITYFMSDGVARAGDGDTATLTNQYAMATDQYEIHPDYGQSDFGIQPAEQAAWEQFLRDHNIKAYAVGMGGDVQPGELDPIAYDGRTGTDMDAVIVDDRVDFQTQLVSGADFSHHGNLRDGGGFGADGGYVMSIAYGGDTFTFDGSQVTRTGNGGTTYSYDAATHTLIITTANQGVLTVDMLTGDYDYVQHGQAGLQADTFTYTLVDNDGDTASGNLSFEFSAANAGTPAPNDDRVIVAHVVTGVDDPYVNNHLVLRDEWLLWNDSDPQGDPLSIDGVGGVINHYTEYYTPTVAHDAANNVVNYTWQYDQGYDNHFYYAASDGQNTSTARVGLEYGDDVVLSTYVFDPEAPYVKTIADNDGTIIIGYDNPDHPGLKNIIHAQGGNDVVVGGAGNDVLYGDAGNDWLVGGAGNDLLVGGTGNDLLEGGNGADTFIWHLADRGAMGHPAYDVIRDFNTTEGDALDMRDLLVGENSGNLDHYLDIALDGNGNTVIRVSSTGGFTGGNYVAGAEDQRITLQGVDLYSQYGVTADHESDLIMAMLDNKSLLVD